MAIPKAYERNFPSYSKIYSGLHSCIALRLLGWVTKSWLATLVIMWYSCLAT